MSHFYASVQGAGRNESTCTGTKSSGIHAHIRGEQLGVRVDLFVDKQGRDRVSIALTHGSYGNGPDKEIGTFLLEEDMVEAQDAI